jgi:hypothetical protein
MECYGISIYSGNYVRIWGTIAFLSSLGGQWMSQLGEQWNFVPVIENNGCSYSNLS